MAGACLRRVGFALFVLTGCQDRVQIIQPPPLDGLQSGVFARLGDDRNTQAILTPTEGLLITQPGQGGDRLVFAGYEKPVESFAWPAGDLPVLADAEDASFLPVPDRQWVLEPGQKEWRSLTNNMLAEVPLARPLVSDCLSSGGCYQGLGDAERADCRVCDPEPPAETLMPEPVQWDTWSNCPVGATLVADDDLALQVCELPDLLNCDQYQWQPMLSSTCRELVSCGAGRFAPARPEDVTRLFVDQNAAPGGDGLTEARALNSLSQAAAMAMPATSIYLADGDYDLPVFATRLNLIGRCPQRVTLSGLGVSNATVSVNRLAVGADVVVQAGGHVNFSESWIEGAVTVAGATANFETTLRRVSMNGLGGGPLLFDGVDAQLDEVVIRDTHDCGPALTSSISDITAHRFGAARIAAETVVVESESHVVMQDVLLSKGNQSASVLPAFDLQSRSTLILERAKIEEQNDRVFSARGEDTELELYDVTVTGLSPVRGRQSRVFEARQSTVRGARIRVSDAVEVVLAARDSTYRLSDLSTSHVTNPVRATDEADVEITRSQFDETYGIVGCAQYGGAVRLSDVVVQGVRAEGGIGRANCPNGVVARGVGFSTSVDGGLVVTRFVVNDTEGSVFLSFKPETILAREGLVQRAAVAVVGDEKTQLSEFVIRMRYEDIGQALLSR